MKTTQNNFLSGQTSLTLHDLKKKMNMVASIPRDLEKLGMTENASVLALDDVNEWLLHLPCVQIYQSATKNLSHYDLDRYEQEHFEEKLTHAGEIETYLSRFSLADPLSDDALLQIIDALSIPLKEAIEGKGKFIRKDELITNVALRRTLAFIKRDAGGYCTFNGFFFDLKLDKKMDCLDIALNLMGQKLIIPAVVFADFVNVVRYVGEIKRIGKYKISHAGDYYHSHTDSELDQDRHSIEGKLFDLVNNKYPCLQEVDLPEMGKLLLNYYTMPPIEIIARFGGDVICIPFKIPKEFELTPDEKLQWFYAQDSKDGQTSKIQF